MVPGIDDGVMRLTTVLLAGGACLIGVGTAGVAASPLVVLAFGALGAVLFGIVRTVGWPPDVGTDIVDSGGNSRVSVVDAVADLWVGPVLAALVVVLWLDATAAEVQALGGVLGLLGMVNYFLRPLYHLLYGIGAGFVRG